MKFILIAFLVAITGVVSNPAIQPEAIELADDNSDHMPESDLYKENGYDMPESDSYEENGDDMSESEENGDDMSESEENGDVNESIESEEKNPALQNTQILECTFIGLKGLLACESDDANNWKDLSVMKLLRCSVNSIMDTVQCFMPSLADDNSDHMPESNVYKENGDDMSESEENGDVNESFESEEKNPALQNTQILECTFIGLKGLLACESDDANNWKDLSVMKLQRCSVNSIMDTVRCFMPSLADDNSDHKPESNVYKENGDDMLESDSYEENGDDMPESEENGDVNESFESEEKNPALQITQIFEYLSVMKLLRCSVNSIMDTVRCFMPSLINLPIDDRTNEDLIKALVETFNNIYDDRIYGYFAWWHYKDENVESFLNDMYEILVKIAKKYEDGHNGTKTFDSDDEQIILDEQTDEDLIKILMETYKKIEDDQMMIALANLYFEFNNEFVEYFILDMYNVLEEIAKKYDGYEKLSDSNISFWFGSFFEQWRTLHKDRKTPST